MLKKFGMQLTVCFLAVAIVIGGCSSKKSELVSTAEKYPTKPITLIVPTSAGGSVDFMARAMEKAAVKHLGQPLVILNIPGGGATLGWNELAGAKPDGYTIGVTTTGLILQPICGQTRFHYPTAIDPIAQAVSLPTVVVVPADQPWENINDLVNYAKKHPGEIKFAHPGLGSARHVVGEMFAKEANIKISQVPFSGEAEALAALLGGHIKLTFVNLSIIKEHVKSGKVKVLGTVTEQRLTDPGFENVQTLKEQGLNVVFSLWYGIGVPKGLPEDVRNKLAEGLKAIIHDSEFKKKMEESGMQVEYLGSQESSGKWITENERLTKVIKETGIAEQIAKQKK